MNKNDASPFWTNYNPWKHAALIRAKNQARMVWFTMVYLAVTTLFFLFLLAAIAFGNAKLPENLVNVIAAGTIGQFAGAPILLYRALFRKENR